MGPKACSFVVLMPISAPSPNSNPSLKRVEALTSTVEEFSDHYIYVIHRCPVCWGRKGEKPLCHAAVGLLQEGLRWVSGGHEFKVDELQCIAVGEPTCVFHINKEPVS